MWLHCIISTIHKREVLFVGIATWCHVHPEDLTETPDKLYHVEHPHLLLIQLQLVRSLTWLYVLWNSKSWTRFSSSQHLLYLTHYLICYNYIKPMYLDHDNNIFYIRRQTIWKFLSVLQYMQRRQASELTCPAIYTKKGYYHAGRADEWIFVPCMFRPKW